MMDPKQEKTLRIVKRAVIGAAAVLAVAAAAFDSTYTISEQEEAVVTTLGTPASQREPGLHFKIPLIQKVHKVNTTIQGFPIGYNQDSSEGKETAEDESLMITSDYNFVNVDFFVEYKVADPVKAVYASEDPELILKNVAQSCIRNVIGSYDVDSVLTTGKVEIQNTIKDAIIKQLENQDIGLSLVNISIQDSQPPTTEVMEAFKAVETAKQGKETALNNANKYQNEKLPEAEAEADKILQDAESQKQARINEANSEVARFNAMYEQYLKNPAITKQRMFYEAMEDVLPDMKVVINGSDANVNTILPLEPFGSADGNAATEGNVTAEGKAGEPIKDPTASGQESGQEGEIPQESSGEEEEQ